jgi:hypothetical protein
VWKQLRVNSTCVRRPKRTRKKGEKNLVIKRRTEGRGRDEKTTGPSSGN